MPKQRYGKYPAHSTLKRNFAIHFFSLSVLSLAFISGIAILSNAQLRLSGEILAADGDELVRMEELSEFSRVELLRETEDLKLYLLERDGKKYLAEVVKDESGEWKVESIEKVRE